MGLSHEMSNTYTVEYLAGMKWLHSQKMVSKNRLLSPFELFSAHIKKNPANFDAK
jgi:hypothetical protein